MSGSDTRFLERPGGTLAYSVIGTGPLVVCSPGLGDLRSTFADVARLIAAGGFRVAAVDLRGHGESSVGWPSYAEHNIADDLLAVAKALDDRPAVLLGNSYSGGAAVVAAAGAPESVAGIVLCGAFVRDSPRGPTEKAMMRLVTLPRLGQTLWMSYWPKLFGAVKPANFEQRRQELAINLAQPGRFTATREMIKSSHAAAERALPSVTSPALVIMGDRDPDFTDPAGEARATADQLGGRATVMMVQGAGHYPHAENPETVALAVVNFLRDLDRGV